MVLHTKPRIHSIDLQLNVKIIYFIRHVTELNLFLQQILFLWIYMLNEFSVANRLCLDQGLVLSLEKSYWIVNEFGFELFNCAILPDVSLI